MSAYWIWSSEPSATDVAVINGGATVVDRLDVEFDIGLDVRRQFPLIEIVRDDHSQGTLADSVIVRGAGLLFSSRLRRVLAAVSLDNIQYFPVLLRNPRDGTETDDYQLANIVGRVSCIDRLNSVLELSEEGNIEFVEVLAIDELRTNGLDLFRLSEELEMIVASSRVRDACLAHQITGVEFFEPGQYPY